MISPDTADKLFEAVQILRDELPLIQMGAAALAPELAPELLIAESLLSKVFEVIVRMRAAHDAESAKPALATATVAAAQAQLDLK